MRPKIKPRRKTIFNQLRIIPKTSAFTNGDQRKIKKGQITNNTEMDLNLKNLISV